MAEVLQPLLVLTPSKGKWIRILLISLAFVACGWWMLSREEDPGDRTMAWLCICFFGLGIPIALFQLLSQRNHTLITASGIHVQSMFRNVTYAWKDIHNFGVAEWSQWHGPFRQRHRLVGMNFKEGSEPLRKVQGMAGISTALVGYHGALPDNYGYKHQELASLLNGYLQRYGTAGAEVAERT